MADLTELTVEIRIRYTQKARILRKLGWLIRWLPACVRQLAFLAIRRGTFVRTGGAEWCLADAAHRPAPPSRDAGTPD